jgi:hypothetical protein
MCSAAVFIDQFPMLEGAGTGYLNEAPGTCFCTVIHFGCVRLPETLTAISPSAEDSMLALIWIRMHSTVIFATLCTQNTGRGSLDTVFLGARCQNRTMDTSRPVRGA